VYWWGFQLTLPGSPLHPEQEPDLAQFVTYSVPPSVVTFMPDATPQLIAGVVTSASGLESSLAPASTAPLMTWQRQLPNRLCDTARRIRSGVLLV